jgi:hypothetical protein
MCVCLCMYLYSTTDQYLKDKGTHRNKAKDIEMQLQKKLNQ